MVLNLGIGVSFPHPIKNKSCKNSNANPIQAPGPQLIYHLLGIREDPTGMGADVIESLNQFLSLPLFIIAITIAVCDMM